ncbi:MAG: NADH-quinone oxidoreductase subunit A [Candidatus Thorarchaeota archaeon]|nr:MAG: NADH-quinone oxidoreductase subunit A [Candidatus Thorarchaeota archaeon]
MRLFIDFVPVLIWAVLAVVLVGGMLFASWVLRPHVLQNSEKTSSYECGEIPIGSARIAYPYNYLVYTILFLVVDVMGAFLWLLAASSFRLDVAVVWQVLVFVMIIMGGMGFAMKKLPETFLSGQETLTLYRKAKAEKEAKEAHTGGH